jgi:uncharacterized membrane protein YkvA (DUF1232 family)
LPDWLWISLAVFVAVYALIILALIVFGRRDLVRGVAGFIPDCLVFVKRLLGDPQVPRRAKVLLGLLAAYLALPFDLVPDFIPVAGQLDDAVAVALVLRAVVRWAGEDALERHWPGPPESRRVIERLAL